MIVYLFIWFFFSLNCFIFFSLKDINQHVLILTLSMTLFLSCLMNVTFIFRKNFKLLLGGAAVLCCNIIHKVFDVMLEHNIIKLKWFIMLSGYCMVLMYSITYPYSCIHKYNSFASIEIEMQLNVLLTTCSLKSVVN